MMVQDDPRSSLALDMVSTMHAMHAIHAIDTFWTIFSLAPTASQEGLSNGWLAAAVKM